MTRAAWLTDLHLNFLSPPDIRRFLGTVHMDDPDVILIGGDIGDSPQLPAYLDMIEGALQRPVYFVLGNHDYYYSSIEQVRRMVSMRAVQSEYLTWLPEAGVVELGPETALVGHGGWGDGRIGDFLNSPVLLNDYLLIRELAGIGQAERLERLHALGDEAAEYVRRVLPAAFEGHQHVFFLTHVPPFKAACWHQGSLSDDDFLPHFTCKAVGEALLDVMVAQPPDYDLTVLCGHTHGAGRAQIRDNLLVLTGGTEYGQPVVQQMFEIT